MAWADVLRNVPKTQTRDATAELVSIAKGSFDKLAIQIVRAANEVVDCEAEIEKFENAMREQRAALTERMNAAVATLNEARRDWDEMVEARGIRGVLTVGAQR